MPGPAPLYRPDFPAPFVEQARQLVRQRTVAYQLHQRASLVLLLHADPLQSNVQAAAAVHLHPNAVRTWRRRWARGRFVLEDASGRGRKALFSPSGPSPRQSRRLRGGPCYRAAPESAVHGGSRWAGQPRPGAADQPQHGVAHLGGGYD